MYAQKAKRWLIIDNSAKVIYASHRQTDTKAFGVL